MRTQSTANGATGPTDWNATNWRSQNRVVRNLRQRIFRASREGNQKKARSLQKLLLRSHANVLLSVRRVTQDNEGKNTPGVDRLVVQTPEARGKLVDDLSSHQVWRASPVRRVYIPKAKGNLRPLGIPTVRDRCLQAVVKNALEPEWEAQFERNSYGFRPGRGCHDAIEATYSLLNKGKLVWILDADIRGAFDNIDHNRLLSQLGQFPARELIKQWLKAGYMEDNVEQRTERGTPQGGVVSPLLANIALHGMEKALGIVWAPRQSKEGRPELKARRMTPRSVIRYADDFIVCCESREDAERCQDILRGWLKERGLSFSEEKTRIVHSSEGFDFLGFNIRHYTTHRTRSGKVLLIKPSKDAVRTIKAKLREMWRTSHSQRVDVLIGRLNRLIRGWSNYYRHACSAVIFKALDHYMLQLALRWTKQRHPNFLVKRRVRMYFGPFRKGNCDRWVFGNKDTGSHVLKFNWVPIRRHVKVMGPASPDDARLRSYWEDRRRKHTTASSKVRHVAYVNGQRGKCPVCGESLWNGEALHTHHTVLDKADPERENIRNQRVVHLYCHQQVHASRRSKVPEAARRLLA